MSRFSPSEPPNPSSSDLPAQLRIRPMQSYDVDAVATIWTDAIEALERESIRRRRLDDAYANLPPPATPTSLPHWLLRLRHHPRGNHIAELEGQPVGYAVLHTAIRRKHTPFARRRIAHTGNVGVLPGNQGYGIGSRLLGRQLTLLGSHGVNWATIRIEPDDPSHAGLVRRHGFRSAHRRFVYACPRDVLSDNLGSPPTGPVMLGSETIIPRVAHRLDKLLVEKPFCGFERAIVDGFAAISDIEPLSHSEHQELMAGFIKRMLKNPSKVIASHDQAHLCLIVEDQLFLSDEFPEDFAHACLRRYLDEVLPADEPDIISFAIALDDAYSQQVLESLGFVRTGIDDDHLLALHPSRQAAD